jgi:hypothetical protein
VLSIWRLRADADFSREVVLPRCNLDVLFNLGQPIDRALEGDDDRADDQEHPRTRACARGRSPRRHQSGQARRPGPPDRHGLSMVMARAGDRWQIVAFQNTRVEPGGGRR